MGLNINSHSTQVPKTANALALSTILNSVKFARRNPTISTEHIEGAISYQLVPSSGTRSLFDTAWDFYWIVF